jgi:t-SNARE complex subunit (syntaxin)
MELYAQRVRLVDDLRQSLKEELAEVRAIKEDMQTAVNDFRDATYRLNMALKSLNEQRPLSIGIAADEGDY